MASATLTTPERALASTGTGVTWTCSLADLRRDAGMSLEALSAKTAVSVSRIMAIEDGDDPYLSEALRLSVAFGERLLDVFQQPRKR